ncbi:hypothetical protein M5689_009022 [Euphorbia peplus]|nr:hypothetical protein M5689_009022 [Euphorbia peplus]
MASGMRTPTWKERENNKKRERRRRAIASKIFSGLRMYGNFKLPKHCDNNEVLKALCNQAGWIVEEDGTTYRKGSRPIKQMDILGGSASISPCSSNYPSPCASYNPSPGSSSFPSPVSSHYVNGNPDADSLIPWLKNLSSSSSSSASSKQPYNLYGSISAPVTPPLTSPTCRTPRNKNDWDYPPFWLQPNNPFLPSSTPPSPGRQVAPDSAGIQYPQSGPTSPTFSLVSRNKFGFGDEPLSGGGSRMWTPGQSGTCSPAVAPGTDQTADVPMADSMAAEFAFGSHMTGLLKAWEGESEYVSDDLELTLGNSRKRY